MDQIFGLDELQDIDDDEWDYDSDRDEDETN